MNKQNTDNQNESAQNSGTVFGSTDAQANLPWQDRLCYSVILASMPDPADREAYLLKVMGELITASNREWNEEDRDKLGNTLRLFLLNETFSYTDENGVGYVWNVTQALQLIKQSPREVVYFAPQEQGVTIEHIRLRYPDMDEERAIGADLSQPLLFIPFQGNSLLIDGWHRLYRAVAEGVPEVACYELTQEEADSVLVVMEPLLETRKETAQ